MGPNGVLFGTADGGGDNGAGLVFELDPSSGPGDSWTQSILHTFTGGTDGGSPATGVIPGPNGSLFGTAGDTVFMLTPPDSQGDPWTETVCTVSPYRMGCRGGRIELPGKPGHPNRRTSRSYLLFANSIGGPNLDSQSLLNKGVANASMEELWATYFWAFGANRESCSNKYRCDACGRSVTVSDDLNLVCLRAHRSRVL
jgi:hypothetical protein